MEINKRAIAVIAVGIAAVAISSWIYRGMGASDSLSVSREAARVSAKDSKRTKPERSIGAADIGSHSEPSAAISFVQLKAEAERGSPAAQRRLAEVYGFCMAYSLSPTTQLETLDHLAGLAPESNDSILKLKKRLTARCDQVDGGQIIPMEAIQLWNIQAAKNGDPVATVRLRAAQMNSLSAVEARQIADRVIESNDPDAMLELSNLMSRPIADDLPDRYARVAGNPLAGVAWGVAGCRAGAACGYGSITMDSICMSTGRCNYSSYEEFLLGELVPPGERKRLNLMVDQILKLRQP